MKKLLALILSFSILFPTLSNAAVLGFATQKDLDGLRIQIIPLLQKVVSLLQQQVGEVKFGATNPVAGTGYTLSGGGISGSATSIVLSSLTIPQTGYLLRDADFSDTFYATLEPGSRTRQEIVSCTTVTQNAAGTATLSGCTRGLLPYSPFTASSTYQFAHAGGSNLIFSNPPQLYNEFAGLQNTSTITGTWTFSSSSIPRLGSDTTNAQVSANNFNLVNYGTLASTSFSGTVDASESQKGIIEMATQAETAAGASSGTTSAPLVAWNKYFNATSSATTTIPVTRSTGKLDPAFIDYTASTTWTGQQTFGSTTTVSGTLNLTGTAQGNFPGLRIAASSSKTFSGNTTENNIFSISLPGNTLSTSSVVKMEMDFRTTVLSAASSTIRLKYGGTNIATSSIDFTGLSSGIFPSGKMFIDLFGNNSTSSQRGVITYMFGAPSSTAQATNVFSDYKHGTSSIDSTVAQTLAVTLQQGNSTVEDVIDYWVIYKITSFLP